MKKILICFFLLIFLIPTFAQDSSGTHTITKKEFRYWFEQANMMMGENFIDTALSTFLLIRQLDTLNANVNYKIGSLYLQTVGQKYKAERYLEAAIKKVTESYADDDHTETNAPVLAYYYYGQALHLNSKFNDAIMYLEKFKSYLGTKNKELLQNTERRITMCYNGIELQKNLTKCNIVNLGDSLNTEYGEYSATVTADENTILFTSTRPGMGGLGNKTIEGGYFEDIWIAQKDKSGNWMKAKNMGNVVNTYEHDALIGISADGQKLLIYRDDKGDGNIYISQLNGDVWSTPEKFGENQSTDVNSKFWEPSACYSYDGNTLYFVSDRKGGFGGRDLYRVVRLPNGNWSMAQNLGPKINTAYDEDAPFMHPDGKTLIFSSNGHKTMGGFDIFFSTKTENDWTDPINIGIPINTPDDDVFYVLSPDGMRAYYSSAKPNGQGEKDLYMIELESSITSNVVVFKGKIMLNGTDSIPESVSINVVDGDLGTEAPEVRPNFKTGKFIMVLDPGLSKSKTYIVTYRADGLKPIMDTIQVEISNKYTEIEKAVELNPVVFNSGVKYSVTILGKIQDENGKPIPEGKITIVDNTTGATIANFEAEIVTANYKVDLNKGKNYNIVFEADGYLFQSVNIDLSSKVDFKELRKDITLQKPKSGSTVVLNNIFFEVGKATLTKTSKAELDKLYNLLKKNPEMKIEISGHTDNTGSPEINKKLSKQRADAVLNFLVKKGVDKTRMTTQGYGPTQPIAPNNDEKGKPIKKNMKLNRRVEFKVL